MSSATVPGVFLLSTAALSGLLLGCSDISRGGHAGVGPADAPGTVVIGSAVEAAGINQLTSADSRFSQDIIDLLFLHLFEEQPDFAERAPTFKPEIVSQYSWSKDNLDLRLDLRQDIVWSDGVPLTAEDVRWSFEAQTHPDVAWSYAHSKEAIQEVEVLGPYSVLFRFSHVYSSRLADVNQGVVMPKHVWSHLPLAQWRGNGNWFLDNLVVSGPYSVADWHPQEEVVLERNSRFYRSGLPHIPQVVFRVIPERSNRIRQLLSGDLDFVEQLTRDDARSLSTSGRARPVSYWHRQYSFVVWNGCREPFVDPRIRLAMTLAIDRQALVDALFGDMARQGVGPIPQSVWAFHDELHPWPYDPDRATDLLAQAGWQDHNGDGTIDREGRPFRFELSTNGDNQLRVDAAIIIQSQLSRIGIDVRIVTLEFNTLIDLNMRHDFDATIAAWGIDTTLDFSYAFHSSSADDGYNYSCYTNPRVDELIGGVRHQPSLQHALPLLHELQAIIHHDQPYTFLWEPRRIDGASRRLQNISPNPLSAFFDLEQWRLESASHESVRQESASHEPAHHELARHESTGH
jgi:peptide/nickel transport system substrate-binding protein